MSRKLFLLNFFILSPLFLAGCGNNFGVTGRLRQSCPSLDDAQIAALVDTWQAIHEENPEVSESQAILTFNELADQQQADAETRACTVAVISQVF